MLALAASDPRHMASYSVSDAVATFYLYDKYIHNFVFSLCTIIPMNAEDVLRKGSGTLCESLLMVEAYRGNIVCPNKQVDGLGATYEGHLLETETYLGGHVECLESGVFRADIPTTWKLVPDAFQELIDKVDRALTFAIEVEHGFQRWDITNYDDVRSSIIEKLEMLRDYPTRLEEPVIYHLDVAAMYPNIILTNRLEPSAIVTEETCAACDFSAEESNRCQRKMDWMWRGEYFPATREETEAVRSQLHSEAVGGVPYKDLPYDEQAALLKARLKTYCQTVYKHVKDTTELKREAVVCQRENPFYVQTVRAFRDRRYEYKGLTKKWHGNVVAAEKAGNLLEAEDARRREVLYDSLQLAHKCILNSFYGYVMRKGARWHSMEMAGVVTLTGSTLIQQARALVEQVGRPLELDTDGIWCVLPKCFPQNFTFLTASGKKAGISYPCVMLNAEVHDKFTNHQYQELLDPTTRTYAIRSECSIFFELDGPYKAMVLPASQEEGKLLKKRYAVFKLDGSLGELKGFELKRRGELKMIKVFQQQVFDRFLDGTTLAECYDAVAQVANYWLDVLDTQGAEVGSAELIEFLSENRSMSKALDEYGEMKGVAISTAKRLAEFLGAEMVKDKGLACKLLIARSPAGAPVSDRAIPTTIFDAEPAIMRTFLRRWCKDSSMNDFDVRSILDWEYYRTRLGAAILKIIVIPAGLQGLPNPVPRIAFPDWLARMAAARNDAFKQSTLSQWLAAPSRGDKSASGARGKTQQHGTAGDIEDLFARGMSKRADKRPTVHASSPSAAAGDAAMHDGGNDDTEAAASDSTLAAAEPAAAVEDAAPSVVQPPPLPVGASTDEVSTWLTARKVLWRELRNKRRRDPTGSSSIRGGSALSIARPTLGGRAAMAAFLRPHSNTVDTGAGAGFGSALSGSEFLAATRTGSGGGSSSQQGGGRGYWQVIELREDPATPGTFTVFAFTAPRKLHAFRLSVDRTLYVNRRVREDDDAPLARSSTLVSRRLPHDAPAGFVYQLTLPERRYRRILPSIDNVFQDPDVLGVYETGTPPLMRALLGLGCVARLDMGARRRLMEQLVVARSEAGGAGSGSGRGEATGVRWQLPISGAASRSKPRPTRQQPLPSKGKVVQPRLGFGGAPSPAAPDAPPAENEQAVAAAPVAGPEDDSAAMLAVGKPASPADARPDERPARAAGDASADVSTPAAAAAVDFLGAGWTESEPPMILQYPATPPPAAVEPESDSDDGDDGTRLALSQAGSMDHPASVERRRHPQHEQRVVTFDTLPAIEEGSLFNEGAEKDGITVDHSSEHAVLPAAAAAAEAARLATDAGALAAAAGFSLLASELAIPPGSQSEAAAVAAENAAPAAPLSPSARDIDDALMSPANPAEETEAARAAAGTPRAAAATAASPPPTSPLASSAARVVRAKVRRPVIRFHSAGSAGADELLDPGAFAVAASGKKRGGGKGRGGGVGSGVNAGDSASSFLSDPWALAVTTAAATAAARGVHSGVPPLPEFSLSDLELLTTSSCAYIDPSSAVFRRAFLFHASAPSSTSSLAAAAFAASASENGGRRTGHSAVTPRAITSLFVIEETSTASAETYFAFIAEAKRASVGRTGLTETELNELRVDAAKAMQGTHIPVSISVHTWITAPGVAAAGSGGSKAALAAAAAASNAAAPRPAFAATWARICSGQLHPDCSPSYSYTAASSQEDVWRQLSLRLGALLPDASPRNAPLVLLAATPLPKPVLVRLIPALAHIPAVPMDDELPPDESAFSGLRWTTALAASAIASFCRSISWWHMRCDAARYCQVPVANLGDTGGSAGSSGSANAMALAAASAASHLLAPGEAETAASAAAAASLFTWMADLFYARMLAFNGHVLWLSTNAVPDLGSWQQSGRGSWQGVTPSAVGLSLALAPSMGGNGSATGAFDWDGTTGAAGGGGAVASATTAASAAGVAGAGVSDLYGAPTVLTAPSPNPLISWPGAYRCVCYELRLEGLEVNTVLNSGFLLGSDGGVDDGTDLLSAYETQMAATGGADGAAGEPDGGAASAAAAVAAAGLLASSSAGGGASGALGGGASCVGAFRALKRLVANWHHDHSQSHNLFANALLERFYTWVASPSSLLHDPALHHLVHALCRRLFDALLRALRAAGLTLVHASRTSLVVATMKQTGPAASAALTAALTKVLDQPQFVYLHITTTREWHHLLWLDHTNFVGMRHATTPAPQKGGAGGSGGGEHEAAVGDAAADGAASDDGSDADSESAGAAAAVAVAATPPASPHSGAGAADSLDETPRGLQQQPQQAESAAAAILGRLQPIPGDMTDWFLVRSLGAWSAALETGASAISAAAWAALQRDFVTELTAGVDIDPSWTVADYLPPRATAAFRALVLAFLLKPFRERSRREFRRLRAKFEELVEPLLWLQAGRTDVAAITSPAVHRLLLAGSSGTQASTQPGGGSPEQPGAAARRAAAAAAAPFRSPGARGRGDVPGGGGGGGDEVLSTPAAAAAADPASSLSAAGLDPAKLAAAIATQLNAGALRTLLRAVTPAEAAKEAAAELAYLRGKVMSWLKDRAAEAVGKELLGARKLGPAEKDPEAEAIAAGGNGGVLRPVFTPLPGAGSDSAAGYYRLVLPPPVAATFFVEGGEEGTAGSGGSVPSLQLLRQSCASAGHYTAGDEAAAPAARLALTLVHFLSLDDRVREEVGVLRSTLLAQLGIREFSPAARFVDPCPLVVLPDVVCPACRGCRDVDLVRDPHLRATAVGRCDATDSEAVAQLAAAAAARPGHIIVVLQEPEDDAGAAAAATPGRRGARRGGRARRASCRGGGSDEDEEGDFSDEDDDEEKYGSTGDEEEDEDAYSEGMLDDDEEDDDGAGSSSKRGGRKSRAAKRGIGRSPASKGRRALRRGRRLPDSVVLVRFSWACGAPACSAAFAPGDLEDTLVATVEGRNVVHVLQDLVCVKCRRVRVKAQESYCECGGRYAALEPAGAFEGAMNVYGTVARAFGFALLAEAVAQVVS